MTNDLNPIEILRKKGWTKYRIAQALGVSWNTVHLWHKGAFKPKKEYQERLDEITKKVLQQ